jgi:hypothetical protein
MNPWFDLHPMLISLDLAILSLIIFVEPEFDPLYCYWILI